MRLVENILCWPVNFVYPEYKTSDFIESFSEIVTIGTMLSQMFSESPSWDEDKKYVPEKMNVWIENREKEQIYKIDINAPLCAALRHQECYVYGGCPNFIITIHESPFEKHFLKGYFEK